MLQPAAEIENAGKFQWPILTGGVLLLHFTFMGAFWRYHAEVVNLFRVQDSDEKDEKEDSDGKATNQKSLLTA